MSGKMSEKEPERKWSLDASALEQLSADLCAGTCKQTKISMNDLDKIRATIRGHVRDPAGEQPLHDYMTSEPFDQRSVLAGATLAMVYITGWVADPSHVGETIGSDNTVNVMPPAVAGAFVTLVCDVLDIPDSDVINVQNMVGSRLRGTYASVDQIIQSESLDARSVAAGTMLLLVFFENVNADAPVISAIKEMVNIVGWLDCPTIIPDDAVLKEALEDCWGVLEFTLFTIDASEQQREEAVLRYNALRHQCRLPPGAALVEIDNPTLRHPITMQDLINMIRHIEGITRLVHDVMDAKTAATTTGKKNVRKTSGKKGRR